MIDDDLFEHDREAAELDAPEHELDWPAAADLALPVESDDDPSSFAVAVGTASGIAALTAMRRHIRRRPPGGEPRHDRTSAGWELRGTSGEPPPRGAAATLERVERLEADRRELVALCIELDDLLAEGPPRARLRRGLRRLGVEATEPCGDAFDAEIHCAVATEPTTDAARDQRIASVLRAGFRSAGAEIRPPEVIVYRFEHGAGDD